MYTYPPAAAAFAAGWMFLVAPFLAQAVEAQLKPIAPEVRAATALSARPAPLSVGSAGPVNRHAFDVLHFAPEDPSAGVVCIYPHAVAYRCAYEFAPAEVAAATRRVIVEIPDLDKGENVTVRFSTSRGTRDASVKIANSSQVVHEIEALLLPSGGQTTVGSNGAPAPVTQLATERAATVPAMATSPVGAPPVCDQVYAQWIGATATDPVFTSVFGALNGAVALSRLPARGSSVRPENLPEWLITYPLSATRVQFIAHYEIEYRIGACQQKLVIPQLLRE
jgi:hypothetical protein